MRILASVALLVFSLQSREASACTCFESGFSLPIDGATGVPTNVRIWHGKGFGPGPGHVSLSAAGQDDVILRGGTVTIASAFIQPWVAPQQPLRPNTQYFLRLDGELVRSFTTGEGPDTTPPRIPVETVRDVEVSVDSPSTCGDHFGVSIGFKNDTDRALLVARVDGSSPEPDYVAAYSLVGMVHLGNGLCSPSWPQARVGATTPAVFGALDLAGNFSGWSTVTEVVIDGDGFPGGCASAEASLVGLLLVWRRRRPGTRTS